MSRRKDKRKDPALEQEGFKRRLYCWIRQRRAQVAVYKTIYYDLNESMLEDHQFDYLEAELEAVESRHPDVAVAVTLGDGYMPPHGYVGSPRLPNVTERARKVLASWAEQGRPRLDHIPSIGPGTTPDTLYRGALASIAAYPI